MPSFPGTQPTPQRREVAETGFISCILNSGLTGIVVTVQLLTRLPANTTVVLELTQRSNHINYSHIVACDCPVGNIITHIFPNFANILHDDFRMTASSRSTDGSEARDMVSFFGFDARKTYCVFEEHLRYASAMIDTAQAKTEEVHHRCNATRMELEISRNKHADTVRNQYKQLELIASGTPEGQRQLAMIQEAYRQSRTTAAVHSAGAEKAAAVVAAAAKGAGEAAAGDAEAAGRAGAAGIAQRHGKPGPSQLAS